jgi:hypothetical protein
MPRYDDDDAFDANGLLKDGHRVRVPMTLMDSLQRELGDHFGPVRFGDGGRPLVTDGSDNPLGLHRPGQRLLSGDTNTLADAREEAYRLYDQADAEAYKRPTGEFVGQREGDEDYASRDALSVTDAREQAYRDYDEAAADAWRNPT